jgi:hypothetical protein
MAPSGSIAGGIAMPQKEATAMKPVPWDQPATLIDLAGKAPLIATIKDCVRHYAMFKPDHQAQARILLTQPVAREGQKTRTWILEPKEIEDLFVRLRKENV